LRRILPMEAHAWRIAADTVPILLAPAYGEIVSIRQALGVYRLHRRAQDASLLMNNAPSDLWDEYWRIAQTKAFVAHSLDQLKIARRRVLLMAPWEARIAALCVRFGGWPPATLGGRWSITLRAFASLLRWPGWGLRQKVLQAAWMLLVLLLPVRAARRVARIHQQEVGLPTTPTATAN
jgi:hypothetical protein